MEEWFERALATETGVRLMQALKLWADAKLITWFYSTAYEEETKTRRAFFDAQATSESDPIFLPIFKTRSSQFTILNSAFTNFNG